MSLRVYLDENLPAQVARAGRGRGLDATSSHEVGRDSLSDDAQLLWAAEQGRCLVTRDVNDFPELTRRFAEKNLPHAGVVLVPDSLPNRNIGAIVQALLRLAQLYPDGLSSYTVMYLSPSEP